MKTKEELEIVNHFHVFDELLKGLDLPLSQPLILDLHRILMNKIDPVDQAGRYKTKPNTVGGRETAIPAEVEISMDKLLETYDAEEKKNLVDLLQFHVRFERIHPFHDGNGRIGRLILFRECLRNQIEPFILEETSKMYYFRGIQEWNYEKGYLLDTCRFEQDRFNTLIKKAKIDYE